MKAYLTDEQSVLTVRDMDNARKIIDELGGTAATARLCQVRPQAVSQWKQKGIPRAVALFLRAKRPDLFRGK